MFFPPKAVERAMQIKEVLLRAMNKEYSWLRAAEILGITPRGLRRLRQRMDQFGYQGLVDMRHGRPSPRRTPVAEVERILELYRERYPGLNGRHFWQLMRRDHAVKLSYSCVKQILQGAGLLKKGRTRGRHRRRRERKESFGQMLHLDGSPHRWLELAGEDKQTLIQVIDDATNRLLYAQLWDGETVHAVLNALREVFSHFGIPESLYTDRAGWAFETPKAGEKVSKTHLTQVGQALNRLGIRHIPSYSPQARGRSERMNRTLQDRLVNELRAAGVSTVEQANAYLQEHYICRHNEFLARPPQNPASAFAPVRPADLHDILCIESVRMVGKDNVVTMDGIALQIARQPGRATCAGVHVVVRRHLDGGYSVRRGVQIYGRYDSNGRPVEAAGPVENRRRTRFPTRTLDAGKRRRRPQLPQAPAPAKL
jgi:homeodomain-containing protein